MRLFLAVQYMTRRSVYTEYMNANSWQRSGGIGAALRLVFFCGGRSMKRSQINAKIRLLERLAEREGFKLPPFLGWSPEEWHDKGAEYDEIRDTCLGWDVTDYGMGDYDAFGITLVTLRNGNANHKRYPKPYAEKLIRIQEKQISPMHFHWSKMEDIINRGGGNLMMKLYNATRDNRQDTGNVAVYSDGRRFQVPSGHELRLTPGESITIYPYCFH